MTSPYHRPPCLIFWWCLAVQFCHLPLLFRCLHLPFSVVRLRYWSLWIGLPLVLTILVASKLLISSLLYFLRLHQSRSKDCLLLFWWYLLLFVVRLLSRFLLETLLSWSRLLWERGPVASLHPLLRPPPKSSVLLTLVMNWLDPIEELYDMYSEEEDTPRIVELVDDGLDFDSDVEGPADPYMDL